MAEDEAHSSLFGAVSQTLLAAGLGFRFRARGTSMESAIRDGDLLRVMPVVIEELRKGDIVLFADGTNFRAHRLVVVDRDRGIFVTRGDSGTETDGVLRAQQILGKVIAKDEAVGGHMRTVRLCGTRAHLRHWAARLQRSSFRVLHRMSALNDLQLGKKLILAAKYSFMAKLWLPCFLAMFIAPLGLFGQVAIDSTTSVGQEVSGATPTVTLPHTTGVAGMNRLLIVGVSVNITNNPAATVTAATYNGTPLTVAGVHNDAGNTRRVEMWSLIAPAIGANNVVVTLNLPGGTGTLGVVVGAITFTGADQTSPLRPVVAADGAAGTFSSMNVPSAVNEMIVDTLAVGGDQTISAFGPTQTSRWNLNSTNNNATTDVRGTGSTRAGAPSVPLSETFSGTSNWSLVAVAVKPFQADVTVSVAGSSAFFPQNLTFTLRVTNNGPSTATATTLTDTLAGGLTLVSATPTQGTCAGSAPIICILGAINAGSTATVTVLVTPSAMGAYTNTATVAATSPDLDSGNNSAIGVAFSQTNACANPGNNGNGGTLGGVINTYYPATASAGAGSTSITVGASRGAAVPIATGDLLLVIQMQDAAINSTNTSSYGDGATGSGFTNLNNSGNYEFVTATSAVPVSGGTANLSGTGPGGGLLYGYTNSAATGTQGQRTYQVVRVPQYSTATLSSSLTASAWNGSTGGILALDVAGTLNLGSAAVSVDGLGFRGGAGMQLTGAAGSNADFRFAAPAAYTGAAVAGADAPKAEGIAGTPHWVESGNTFLNTGAEGYPNGSMARGAPGNAGGGGTDGNPAANNQNSGGGGGGNGGAGGVGGNSWNSNLSVGGLGGAAFPAAPGRIVLGGGGGAASRNNSPGDNRASSGAAGGGLMIIRAGNLSGAATLSANGMSGYNGTLNDGGSGGGAGGSIIVTSAAGGTSGLTVLARGGRGGDAWDAQAFSLAQRHGPGGGGGGGVALLSGSVTSIDVSGGANGTTLTPGAQFGATGGAAGVSSTNVALSQTPGVRSGAECTPDLTIAKSHSGNFVRGASGTYTITVSNISLDAASSGLVSVIDTLPGGLTPTAASGTGWSCGVAGQTVSCTRSDALAAISNYPAITVTVSVAQAAGASLLNTATVSGGNELNTTNDTASDITTIVSSSDLAITKTGAPDPAKPGDVITYTLTVSNSGPTNATNVTVTDTLPSTVSYISATPTQGTCSQTTGTVTCLLGGMNAGSSASISIQVTAVTPSSAVNTASVTADQPDPDSSNNSATVTTLITFPTQVKLESFTATVTGTQVLLSWKTGGELRNLGFNVYREANGERIRLNPSLIAGSALIMKAALPQHTPKTYAWIDYLQDASHGLSPYWLEDVDVDGTRTLHGPVSPELDLANSNASPAKMVTELNNLSVGPQSDTLTECAGTALSAFSNNANREVQFDLAASRAVKVAVSHDGWYRITQPELVATGLRDIVDSTSIRLFLKGVEQPLRITGTNGSFFGPQAGIEFYGRGQDGPYSDKSVYWLTVGDKPGKRIHVSNFEAGGPQPQSFPCTIVSKERTTYFAALLRDNTDNFFGALVSSAPVDQVIQAMNLASPATGDAELEVVLQGVIEGASHNVNVSLNGATLGTLNFAGQDEGSIRLRVPGSLVHEGNNIVTLTAQDRENDLSLVDFIKLTYPHTYTAQLDSLKFTAEAGERVTVNGFRRSPTRLQDITRPDNPVALIPRTHRESGNFALEATVPAAIPGTHTLLALSEEQMAKPSEMSLNQPSHWHGIETGSEVVIVSNSKFVDQLAPLVSLRRSQGKMVALVNIDDLYDEFSFGERNPSAIRDFLLTASSRWQVKPKYLLLVGDASVDPRDYLGFGFFDLVPTKIITTSELKTASDDWFSDFANTGFAQISTGRIPVRTEEDARAVVSKIVRYERTTTPADWTNQALLVADQDDPTVSFTQEAEAVRALMPKSMNITDVFATGVDPAAARATILDNINSGKVLVDYLGHGSVEVWSGENLLDTTIAATLTNGPRLPVFLIMNCLNGFFHDVYTESLAESLLLSKNGGAIGVWASSGLTSPEPQSQMNRNVVHMLFTQRGIPLGDAIRRAKSDISDSDARRTFILFGDPLLRLK